MRARVGRGDRHRADYGGSNPPSPGWKPGFPPLGPHPRRRDSRACARRLPPGPIPIPREAAGEGIEPPRASRPGYRIRNGRISALPARQRATRDRSGRLPACLDAIEPSPLTRHGHGASPRLVSSHRALPGRGALGQHPGYGRPADRAEPRSPVQMGNPGDDILGTSIVWLISRPVAALSHVGGALQETHFSPHDDASSLSMASGSIRARALYSRARFTNAGVADFTSSRSPLLIAASMRVTDANLDPDARRTDAGSYSER